MRDGAVGPPSRRGWEIDRAQVKGEAWNSVGRFLDPGFDSLGEVVVCRSSGAVLGGGVGRDVEVETVKKEEREKEREQSEGDERGEEEHRKEDRSCT